MRIPVNDDRGIFTIVVAAGALVILGIGAFAMDFGNTYVAKRKLSTAADAAALAAASELAKTFGNCTAMTTANQASATTVATSYIESKNQTNNGKFVNLTVTPIMNGGNCTGLDVTVTDTGTQRSFLGAVFGIGAINASRAATARLTVGSSVAGLRPYAVCQSVATAAMANPSVNFIQTFDNSLENCNGSPGNWGVVDFNGPPHPVGDTQTWTHDGYPAPITIPGNVNGDPGASFTPLESDLTYLIDKTVLFPVVASHNAAGGSNVTFYTVAFVAAKVCGWRTNNNFNFTSSCHQPSVTNAADALLPKNSKGYLELKYVTTYTTSFLGGSTGTCAFSDTTCDNGVRQVNLVK